MLYKVPTFALAFREERRFPLPDSECNGRDFLYSVKIIGELFSRNLQKDGKGQVLGGMRERNGGFGEEGSGDGGVARRM